MADTDACLGTCVKAKCGDGVVWDSVEACDDGNMVDGDGCTNMCASASCGDGIVQMGEECDDGNMADTDACLATCVKAKCGDAKVQMGVEACDDGMASMACDVDCTAVMCGDNVVNMAAGEVCDDGNMVDTDACVACKAAKCGDGKVQAGVEECDDGNMVNGDGCENTCKNTPMPPECVNYAQLSEAFRNVNNINGAVGCDNPFTQQWYRFTGAAGTRMPNTAPPTYACGTHASGWMNGAYPTVQEGAVARTICFHWSGNTCNWQEPAQVRNCGNFYVFFLKNVSWGCSGRYCGTN